MRSKSDWSKPPYLSNYTVVFKKSIREELNSLWWHIKMSHVWFTKNYKYIPDYTPPYIFQYLKHVVSTQ